LNDAFPVFLPPHLDERSFSFRCLEGKPRSLPKGCLPSPPFVLTRRVFFCSPFHQCSLFHWFPDPERISLSIQRFGPLLPSASLEIEILHARSHAVFFGLSESRPLTSPYFSLVRSTVSEIIPPPPPVRLWVACFRIQRTRSSSSDDFFSLFSYRRSL